MLLKENQTNTKVLLHSCCAICSGQPINHLREIGYEPVVYFFNPNIYPELEHSKRLEAQHQLCKDMNCDLIVENYTPEFYQEVMCGYENHSEGSERCTRCFELRLLKTIQKAKELEINNYTTSISISPHKNFNTIKQIGNFFSDYYGIKFLDFDFRKKDGVSKTNKIAKSLNLYRQDYCGCEVSMNRQKIDKCEQM